MLTWRFASFTFPPVFSLSAFLSHRLLYGASSLVRRYLSGVVFYLVVFVVLCRVFFFREIYLLDNTQVPLSNERSSCYAAAEGAKCSPQCTQPAEKAYNNSCARTQLRAGSNRWRFCKPNTVMNVSFVTQTVSRRWSWHESAWIILECYCMLQQRQTANITLPTHFQTLSLFVFVCRKPYIS